MQNNPFTGKQNDIFQWLLLAAGVFIVYKVYKGFSNIGAGLGLSNPAADAAADAAEASIYVKSDWPGEVIKRFTGTGIDTKEAQALALKTFTSNPYDSARVIYDAKSAIRVGVAGLADDEEKVLNVYRLAGSQFELAAIAKAFSTIYKKDLFGYLDTFLSNSTIQSMHKIAKTKPIYPAAVKTAAKTWKVKLPYLK
jgi:hypothetical protein